MTDKIIPDWKAFGKDVMGAWPTGDVDGFYLQDLAEKHHIILPVDGGFDPEKHDDTYAVCPEPGDPWFERNY